MSIVLNWRTTKPKNDLREAMERLATQVAREGEYHTVTILSTPKTTSGGKPTAPHFKVRLHGIDEGRDLEHEFLIKLEHRNVSGYTWGYKISGRDPRYDYSTLTLKGSGPSHSPKNKRLRREAEAAHRAQATANTGQQRSHHSVTYNNGQYTSAANYGDGSGSGYGGGYGDSSSTAPQTPGAWYPDPWDPHSRKLRWFEGGRWTSHTR